MKRRFLMASAYEEGAALSQQSGIKSFGKYSSTFAIATIFSRLTFLSPLSTEPSMSHGDLLFPWLPPELV